MAYPSRLLKHRGQVLSLSEWARQTGIPRLTIKFRIDVLGWRTSEALETPVNFEINRKMVRRVTR